MDRPASMLERVSGKARMTAVRYFGEKALRYETKRAGTPKWAGEDRKVREYLLDLPEGTTILDIPCGTGRFFQFYRERGFKVLGIDISPDMIAEAQKHVGDDIKLKIGSIFNIGLSEAFDVVICTRFLNLIEAEDVKRVLAEMQRVAKYRIIFTLRVRQTNPSGHYHSPHSISLVEESLLPEWKIGRNEPMYQEDYRSIEVIR